MALSFSESELAYVKLKSVRKKPIMMESTLSGNIKNLRQRRRVLKHTTKRLSVQAKKIPGGGPLSDLLSVVAKSIEELYDDLAIIYQSSYVQTEGIEILAHTILELPEFKNDKKLRKKILTRFDKVHQIYKIRPARYEPRT